MLGKSGEVKEEIKEESKEEGAKEENSGVEAPAQ